jgi:hypothetical protein
LHSHRLSAVSSFKGLLLPEGLTIGSAKPIPVG